MTRTLRRQATVRIEWPRRPRRTVNETFGRRQTWRSRCGRYAIDRFPDSSGKYIAGTSLLVISPHGTLAAAKRACERHARDHESTRTRKG